MKITHAKVIKAKDDADNNAERRGVTSRREKTFSILAENFPVTASAIPSRLTVTNSISFSCTSRNFLFHSGKRHAYSHPSYLRGYSRRDTCESPTTGCPKITDSN